MAKNWLASAFILSLVANVALLALFFFFFQSSHPIRVPFSPSAQSEQVASPTLRATCLHFDKLSFDELASLLSSGEPIEMGYSERDIALAFLVKNHFFDVERALAFESMQRRKLLYAEGELVSLFPGLTESHFGAVHTFLKEELYPITVEGVFKRLKKEGIENNLPLVQAFIQSEPFLLVSTLFLRGQVTVQKGAVMALLLSGSFDTLSYFVEKQKKGADFSEAARQEFLLSYLRDGSKVGAYLLLKLEPSYAIKKLTDDDVLLLLYNLDKKSEEAVLFAKALTVSPRSERVIQAASSLLATFEPICLQKELRPNFRDQPPAAPAPNVHIIEPGESLWTIAHKYHTTVEALVRLNHLQQAMIHPGKTLKLPQPGRTLRDEKDGTY